jgi:hypothetical protein
MFALNKLRPRTSRTPPLLVASATCRPSPCPGLSPGWTTTATPSPWPSRAVGDPMVRSNRTLQHPIGVPFLSLCDLIGHCPSSGRCGSNRSISPQGGHRSQTFYRWAELYTGWTVGLRQSSFHLLCGSCDAPSYNVFRWSPLYVHATVPLVFRPPVSTLTQEHPSKFLPSVTGIRLDVTWRTRFSLEPANMMKLFKVLFR